MRLRLNSTQYLHHATLATALLGFVPLSSFGAQAPNAATSLQVDVSAHLAQAFLRAGVYMEDFESIPPGPIDGVSGWSANSGGFVSLSGSQTGDPAEATFGSASLAVNYDPSGAGSAQAPVFGGEIGQFGIVEFDVLIYEQPAGSASIDTTATTFDAVAGLVNTRVLFTTGGSIQALQVSGGSGAFLATTGSWAFGVPSRIGIEILPENVLNIYQNGALIFAGHDIAQEFGGGAGGANGVQFDTYTDNASGPKPYFDNISVTEAPAPAGATERVSVNSSEAEGNTSSSRPSVSDDGRYIAFHSASDNLVVGDGNFTTDVFVRDRMSGDTTRVSVDSSGFEGNGQSLEPVISGDGRFVAFTSFATNLVADDTNFGSDVFVHDRQTGVTERVSVTTSGDEGSQSAFGGSISGDGRYVVFYGLSPFVAADTNSATDVYVRDRMLGLTERVSVSSAGTQIISGIADLGVISADGRYVAFRSTSPDLVAGDTNPYDIFVHDRQTGMTELVSVSSAGVQAIGQCTDPDISDDGRFIAFRSVATNLVPGDTSGVWYDVFVHDRQTGETIRASVSSAGDEGLDTSSAPALSGDGAFVAFFSDNDNLVDGDTNGEGDAFVHSLTTGATTRVSVSSTGGQGNGDGGVKPAVSADGRFIAFASTSTNLVVNDFNLAFDVFLHDRGPACPTDLDGDGSSDGADLAILLAAWGSGGPSDFTGDGVTDGADLAILLAGWGSCGM